MNKGLYTIGIVSFVAMIALSLAMAIAFQMNGPQLLERPSFKVWEIGGTIIWLIGEGILLNYFFSKKYSVVFTTDLIAVIIALIDYVVYLFKEESLYYITTYLSVGALVVYSLALINTIASERQPLKKAGVAGLILGAILLTLLTIMFFTKEHELLLQLDLIYVWSGTIGNLILIFFIQNYYRELKSR